jgi:hypothetical protein
LRCSFNGSVWIEGRGERLTADGGLLVLRELDERLGVMRWLAPRLEDPRDPSRVRHEQIDLLRTRVFLMAQGHGSQDTVDFLREDPVCRLATSSRRGQSPLSDPLASQPTQSRLLAALCTERNRATLAEALLEQAERSIRAEKGQRLSSVTLDIDSTPITAHGHQPGSAYNGYYGETCFHPLVVMLGETGHWVAAKLRPGNAHTADGAREMLMPLIDQVEKRIARVAYVRGDAGFPEEQLLVALEQRAVGYVFRLRGNRVLDRLAKPFLRREPGRPPEQPRVWLHELQYRAESWSSARRVVLVVKEIPGELYLDHFFLVTSWTAQQMECDAVLEFYRERGTIEDHLGQIKSVLDPSLSSCNRTKSHVRFCAPLQRAEPIDATLANAATFLLYALAYNFAHVARRIVRPPTEAHQPSALHLGTLRDQLLRVAARIVVSARRITVVLNQSVARRWSDLWRALDHLHPIPSTP